jgi:hypothetical protein
LVVGGWSNSPNERFFGAGLADSILADTGGPTHHESVMLTVGVVNMRWVNVAAILFFILVVCPGIYFWLTSPSMGYPAATAAMIAGVPALIGLALLPFAWKGKL